MNLAWLSIDLILVVLFAFSLPVAFLYMIRRWLKPNEEAEERLAQAGQEPPPPVGH